MSVNVQRTRNIRIYIGCEVRIQNSVTRVTVMHHEVYRLMPNSYPGWQNFQFTPNYHYRFFSCLLFLRRLYLSLNNRYFTNFMLKYVSDQEMLARFGIYWRCPIVMHEDLISCRGRLTSSRIREKYPGWIKIAENLFLTYQCIKDRVHPMECRQNLIHIAAYVEQSIFETTYTRRLLYSRRPPRVASWRSK